MTSNLVESASITNPVEGDLVNGIVTFEATYSGTLLDDTEFAWAVREGGGSCPTGATDIAAWRDGVTDYTFGDGAFSTTVDITSLPGGTYCFVINPDGQVIGAPDNRDIVVFELIPNPETKSDCKKGQWTEYGFKNQGQCIRYVNTGKDSRDF